MEDDAFAVACRSQKSIERHRGIQGLPGERFGQRAKRHRTNGHVDLPGKSHLQHVGPVFEHQIDGGYASRGVAQGIDLRDGGGQRETVHGKAASSGQT